MALAIVAVDLDLDLDLLLYAFYTCIIITIRYYYRSTFTPSSSTMASSHSGQVGSDGSIADISSSAQSLHKRWPQPSCTGSLSRRSHFRHRYLSILSLKMVRLLAIQAARVAANDSTVESIAKPAIAQAFNNHNNLRR